MLAYEFMQRAFIVAIFIGVLIPFIGLILVLRRYSMLGDALSHVALSGVCLGVIAGYNPTFGSITACIIASMAVSYIGRNIKNYKEIAIAIIMSLGVGLTGILSGFVNSSVNLNSFLFGSIVSISDSEFYTIIILASLMLVILVIGYQYFMFYAFNEEEAKHYGIKVLFIDAIFTFMIGITISISARIVGALIISSLLVIPPACGLILGKSYKSTLIVSIILSIVFMVSGLIVSYYFDLRPGGTIVTLGCLVYIFIIFLSSKLKL